MKLILSLSTIIILAIAIFYITKPYFSVSNDAIEKAPKTLSEQTTSQEGFFKGGQLTTDMSVHSIPLASILDGGPGKDGIPAILIPAFTSLTEASTWLPEDADGLVVTVGSTTHFYPFNIIVWHEIVNDVIEDRPLVVTFCPLCRSAIVFDAEIDGTRELFGVSGKLYESNLLMYDVTTESLWSQIIGEAVVGTRTGGKLDLVPSQVMTLSEVTVQYPEALVLSRDTGHKRDYLNGPYGDYNTNESLYFPVSISDTRLPIKEIMHIVNYRDKSIAFQRNLLSKTEVATVSVGTETLSAKIVDSEVIVTDSTGAMIPGYTAMWFSWAIHHQEDGIVWKG